jgi:hypothetical protein
VRMASAISVFLDSWPDPINRNIKELKPFQRVKKGVPCYNRAGFPRSCGLSMYSRRNVVRYVKEACPPIGKFTAGNPPFLANLSGRGSNLRYIREARLPLFSIQFSFLLPFFCPPTTQNSLLFYVDAPFSSWLCHHSLLLYHFPPLLPTTRENMPAAQNHPPFIHVNVAPDTRKMSLTNLSYPIRTTHTPWVDSSVPLVIKVHYLK